MSRSFAWATAPLLTVLLALANASCGSEEDVAPQTETATVTPSASATPTAATPTASPAPTATPAPDAIPADWQTYTDPALGFSLRYPPDLSYTDSAPIRGQRALIFRSATDAYRPGFTIGILENPKGITLDRWVEEFTACLPDTIKRSTVDGQAATFCTAEPIGIPELTVLFQSAGMIVHISSTMQSSEFDLIVASIRL